LGSLCYVFRYFFGRFVHGRQNGVENITMSVVPEYDDDTDTGEGELNEELADFEIRMTGSVVSLSTLQLK
jgi:hypothetical protein